MVNRESEKRTAAHRAMENPRARVETATSSTLFTEVTMDEKQAEKWFIKTARGFTIELAEGLAYVLAAVLAETPEPERIIESLRTLSRDPDLADRPYIRQFVDRTLLCLDLDSPPPPH
jgi:hypothetical protein